MEMCDCSRSGTDELLLERLGELAAIVDPVPWMVEASARAAFARRSAKPTAPANPARGQTKPTVEPGAQISGPSEPSAR